MLSTPAPSPRSGALALLEHAFVRLNQWLVIGLMASMAVLVFVNVVMRYLFNQSIVWVEEVTQYEMIWVAYLGAGLALREGRHVAVDTLQDWLPALSRRALRNLLAVAIAVFLAALVVLGIQIAMFTWDQETPVLNVPSGLPYLAVPLGAAAMLLHLVLFWRQFVERRFEEIQDPAFEGE
ncbi:2,3-diketo-L-gulonate TRAP transporter small permease protein YiaM [Burkholderiaceae bacterium]|nr:2,3-diketo-L-gulonate TRAP transporter small permease protein YiaM [Burkholderiaceae bacterium]